MLRVKQIGFLLTVLPLCFCTRMALGQTVWIAKSMQRVQPDTAPLTTSTTAQLAAARGEYESFQIIVRAPAGGGLSNVNVSVSDLSGSAGVIPKSNITLFRQHYVWVSGSTPWGTKNSPGGPGWYPEPLIPFNDPETGASLSGSGARYVAVPFNLAASKNQGIWVDVFVPRTAGAGTYSGTYTVTSNQGNVTGQISLTVWNFTLPLKPYLKTSFQFGHEAPYLSSKELLRNKISPMMGATAYERQLIDNYGLNTTFLGFLTTADGSNCAMPSPPSVSQIQARLATHQSDLFVHNYSADEVTHCTNIYETIKQWARNLHQAGVKQSISIMPVPEMLDDGSGTGRSAVDIWVLLPKLYDAAGSTIQHVLNKGDEVWSYNTLIQDDYTPKWTIDFSPPQFRLQPGFINQSLNITGLYCWRVDYWQTDQWNNVNTVGRFSTANFPGEGVLLYPGQDAGIQGTVPSIRLKWIRDGVEDYDYIQLLKAAGKRDWALQVARTVGPDWTNWTRDPNAIESARQQLGQELHSLNSGAVTTTTTTPVVQPVSVSPASGTGTTQTFSFVYSNSAGFNNIKVAGVLINTAVHGATACWLAYQPSINRVSLYQNETNTWPSGLPGAAVTLSSGRCTLDLRTASVSSSGTTLTLTLPIQFSSLFSGTKTVYMYASDVGGTASAYQPKGTWTVP
jgi:hypothetical protein